MMGNTCLIHNLSRQVPAVTGKNEWSCLCPLRREIAAVFGRSVQVNVLSVVPLLIHHRAPPWLVGAVRAVVCRASPLLR